MSHIFHGGIEAYVERLGYDWTTKIGVLQMAASGYPDTFGIVNFFKHIDGSVKQIDAMFDGQIVIRYLRKPHGWVAEPSKRLS